jgi:hypothetical protein
MECDMTQSRRIFTPLVVTGLAAVAISSVLLWNYSVAFQGDVLGFYRIGTVLPHSPYVTPSNRVLAEGEVGYNGRSTGRGTARIVSRHT